MRHTLLKLTSVVLLSAVIFTACKKNNDPSTQSKLAGTWKFHQQITDANANNVIDAADVTVSADSPVVLITFNSNGSGSQSQAGVYHGSFTWTVNGSYISLTDSGSTSASNLLITSGPGSTLTVADTSEHPRQWTVLNKQ